MLSDSRAQIYDILRSKLQTSLILKALRIGTAKAFKCHISISVLYGVYLKRVRLIHFFIVNSYDVFPIFGKERLSSPVECCLDVVMCHDHQILSPGIVRFVCRKLLHVVSLVMWVNHRQTDMM